MTGACGPGPPGKLGSGGVASRPRRCTGSAAGPLPRAGELCRTWDKCVLPERGVQPAAAHHPEQKSGAESPGRLERAQAVTLVSRMEVRAGVFTGSG